MTRWLTALLWLSLPAMAAAQLSPGPLARPHATLEGSGNCGLCHVARAGVDAAHCLDCHETLRGAIEAGRGLHSSTGYERCESCHMDHNGRDFELVYWGDDGMQAFEHGPTGFELVGAHASVECRDCHAASHVVPVEALRQAGKNLDRTFLGLATACESCHADFHDGGFADAHCTDCHQQTTWVGASGFEHASVFTLAGRHRDLACESCHRLRDPGESSDRSYRGTARTCAACHADPHGKRLGSRCENCHAEDSWRATRDRSFDHSLTRFALRGAHREVACSGCHEDQQTRPIESFDVCASCHEDPHRAEDSALFDADCSSCHTDASFAPSTFGIDRHDSYPLVDAHIEVSCVDCHGGAATGGSVDRPWRFSLTSTECAVCHASPHGELSETASAVQTCVGCHVVTTWETVSFDHSSTGYDVDGPHADLACSECHRHGGDGTPSVTIEFGGLEAGCASCHTDPHAAQFEGPPWSGECSSCHSGSSWSPATFDHDRDSSFKLEGAHARAACEGCHRADAAGVVLYRPLARACADCHGGS